MNARQRRQYRRSPEGMAKTVLIRAREGGAFNGLTFTQAADLARDLVNGEFVSKRKLLHWLCAGRPL